MRGGTMEQLTVCEKRIIVAALRIAAAQYVADAAISRNAEQVAQQFARQSQQASDLADRFEGAQDCELLHRVKSSGVGCDI